MMAAMLDKGDSLSEPLAALDMGSNSFHLIIGREIAGQISVIDRLRDPVRMAEGVDEEGRLSEEKLARVLESLERFGQRLREIPAGRKRAIGTNAFRRTHEPRDLLARASEALGVPIEVLSGSEEARLIYLGVSHDQPGIQGKRLVVDIGGGSTEVILGEGFTPLLLHSFHMGCVSFSMRYFPSGKITRKAFEQAEVTAKLELGRVVRTFRAEGWTTSVGCSGTINSIAGALRGLGMTDGHITVPALSALRQRLIEAGSVEGAELPGVAPDRRAVVPGGLAALKALFESLHIETMETSDAALREGVLYDLVGRIRHEDVRDRTIRSMSERYSVDLEQAQRVETSALHCLDQVADEWKLERESSEQLLSWAARMHEVGLSISHSGHHKHGAYILANSILPGFSHQEQRRLAALVRVHRRKLSRDLLEDPIAGWTERLFKLCILLRLAARLNRSRSPKPQPDYHLLVRSDGLEIRFPNAWLDEHPLTLADLEEESRILQPAGLILRLR